MLSSAGSRYSRSPSSLYAGPGISTMGQGTAEGLATETSIKRVKMCQADYVDVFFEHF